jgi:hypothetical protein
MFVCTLRLGSAFGRYTFIRCFGCYCCSVVLALAVFLHQGRLTFGMHVNGRVELQAYAHRCNNLADLEVEFVSLLGFSVSEVLCPQTGHAFAHPDN